VELTFRVHRGLELKTEGVDGDLLKGLKKAFTYSNPEFHKKERFNVSTWNTPRFLCSYEDVGDTILFPRGGIGKLRKVLDEFGITNCKFIDDRLELDTVEFELSERAQPVTLRPDQEKLKAAIIQRENCLIRSATGSGKTELIIDLIREIGQPSLVVVWSSGLLKQWVERIKLRWGWDENDIGIVGGGKKRIRPLTIAMQQTLWKNAHEIAPHFGLIVGDEIQRWSSRTFQETISQFPARYRIGVSADERRKDRLEVLTHDAFGQVVAEISREELIAQGKLCEVEILVVPTENRIVELDQAPPQDRGQILAKLYTKIIGHLVQDRYRNNIISQIAGHEAHEKGRSIIIFTDRVNHARELSKLITGAESVPCGMCIGGPENRELFEETTELLNNGTIKCAVGTSAVYQGIDIPRLTVGIVGTPTGNNQQLLEQQIGRLRRKFPGKIRGTLYYIWDRHIFPNHLRNLERWYGRDLVRVVE